MVRVTRQIKDIKWYNNNLSISLLQQACDCFARRLRLKLLEENTQGHNSFVRDFVERKRSK